MRWFNKMLWGGAAVLALTLVITSGPAFGSEIRTSLNADIRSTTPGTNRDGNTDAVVIHLVEGLVAYREDGSVGPMLADKIDVSDDELTYTFTLREGVKFHNGETLTAKDVVWSWDRYLDPATEWRCLKDFNGGGGVKIESIEAIDPLTVRFRIDQPSALFLASMARPDCGGSGVVHSSSVAGDGTWIGPVGTGPFTIENWKKGESITLARFPEYASRPEPRDGLTGGKIAEVDLVKFVVVPDSAAAKAALLSGEIDVIQDIPTSTKAEMETKENVELKTAVSMGISAILFQTRDKVIGNVDLRQAIASALDMDQIVGAVTEGVCKPNNSIVPSSSFYYTDVQRNGYKYDPEKTKALLKKAGYKGEPIVLLTTRRFESCYNIAVFAQSMLQAAGLNVKLEVLEWGALLDRYLAGTYQMMAFTYSPRLDPALGYNSVMGDKDKQPRKPWDNPEARKLASQAMKVSDQARRQELFDQLHRMMMADAPMLVLYNGPEIAAYSKKVKGYEPWPLSLPRFWGVKLAD